MVLWHALGKHLGLWELRSVHSFGDSLMFGTCLGDGVRDIHTTFSDMFHDAHHALSRNSGSAPPALEAQHSVRPYGPSRCRFTQSSRLPMCAMPRTHPHGGVPTCTPESARIGGSTLVSADCCTYAHKRPALTTETLTARLGKGRWTDCNCGNSHRPLGERAVQPFDMKDLDSPIQHGGMVHLFLGKRREAFTMMNMLVPTPWIYFSSASMTFSHPNVDWYFSSLSRRISQSRSSR